MADPGCRPDERASLGTGSPRRSRRTKVAGTLAIAYSERTGPTRFHRRFGRDVPGLRGVVPPLAPPPPARRAEPETPLRDGGRDSPLRSSPGQEVPLPQHSIQPARGASADARCEPTSRRAKCLRAMWPPRFSPASSDGDSAHQMGGWVRRTTLHQVSGTRSGNLGYGQSRPCHIRKFAFSPVAAEHAQHGGFSPYISYSSSPSSSGTSWCGSASSSAWSPKASSDAARR